jgi:hypothetical protein
MISLGQVILIKGVMIVPKKSLRQLRHGRYRRCEGNGKLPSVGRVLTND